MINDRFFSAFNLDNDPLMTHSHSGDFILLDENAA